MGSGGVGVGVGRNLRRPLRTGASPSLSLCRTAQTILALLLSYRDFESTNWIIGFWGWEDGAGGGARGTEESVRPLHTGASPSLGLHRISLTKSVTGLTGDFPDQVHHWAYTGFP